jgi:hypothetical protein
MVTSFQLVQLGALHKALYLTSLTIPIDTLALYRIPHTQ